MKQHIFHNKTLRLVVLLVGTFGLGVITVITGQLLSNRSSVAPTVPQGEPEAAAPACTLGFTLKAPTVTPTPKVSKTPTPSITAACYVSFNVSDTAVCWKEKTAVQVQAQVHTLPSTGGPFYLQTAWNLVEPKTGGNEIHYYTLPDPVVAGGSYTMYAEWPGLSSYDPLPDVVEIHLGLNILDSDGNPVSPSCTGSLDYYWTKYVQCP